MRIKRLISIFLALTLIFSCIPAYGETGGKAAQESKTYYQLLWSNYHTWEVSSGKWDHVEPGGKATITESVTLPENAKVEGVYTLRKENNTGISKDAWEKFDFSGDTSRWNDLEYINKKEHLPDSKAWSAYNKNYSNYDVKDFTLVSTDQKGTKFTYKYEYTLKTDNPDSKHKGKGYYLTSKTAPELDKVQSWLGGKKNVKDTAAWVKISAMQKTPTKKTGYCYWVPYIIKYTVGEAAPASLTDPNAKNLIMEKVTFLDKDKKPVSTCEKGNTYYARYQIKYVGEDMDSKKKIVLKDLKIKDTKDGSTIYKSDDKREGEIQKKNGEEFGITYGPFAATEDTIYACATIEYSEEINQITIDDFGEGWIDGNGEEAPTPGAITTDSAIVTPPGIDGTSGKSGEKEDLAIKIERVTPSTTKIYAPNELSASPYNVDCVITYNAATDDNILMTTARISVPDNQNVGKTYENEIQVNVAPGQNRISFAIPNLIVRNKSGSFNIVATVNDRHEYPKEEVTWDNNKDTIKQPISTIAQKAANPCIDPPHTVNKGKVVYQITTRTGYTYKCKDKKDPKTGELIGQTCGCRGGTTTYSEQESTRTETLNLTDIHFISKQSNVNLINTKGKIKAGYGFELNITAVLTGTERPGRPPESSDGCNGRSVSPGKFQLAQLTNRIFVVLPDGQIISNIASGPIKEQMVCSVSSNGDSFGGTVMRCKVKSGNTFGNKETNKLYVDENTKNGTYQMTVCTEKVPSVVIEGEILYDKKIVYYDVDGSYADDVFTHIIQ